MRIKKRFKITAENARATYGRGFLRAAQSLGWDGNPSRLFAGREDLCPLCGGQRFSPIFQMDGGEILHPIDENFCLQKFCRHCD